MKKTITHDPEHKNTHLTLISIAEIARTRHPM
jgi:hypothetical protein